MLCFCGEEFRGLFDGMLDDTPDRAIRSGSEAFGINFEDSACDEDLNPRFPRRQRTVEDQASCGAVLAIARIRYIPDEV